MSENKELYLNFDEYIRQGEPAQREKAVYWQAAIGLQAVDGLKTSEYLQQTARRNIEGEITIDEERAYSYKGKSQNEMISHLTQFVSVLWLIHAFGEGNTRTTAVFTIQYLRSLGFNVNNDPFARHSWYFRNALVRANYRNVAKGIDNTPVYLERFFRNLLLGEQWDLRNRYLHIHPTEEWSVQPNLTQEAPEQVPEQAPEQAHDLVHTNNPLILELIKIIGKEKLSIAQLMEKTGLKHRPNFIEYHLNPSMKEGFVRLLYADKPRHPRQKYLLTVKGMALYKELTKEQ